MKIVGVTGTLTVSAAVLAAAPTPPKGRPPVPGPTPVLVDEAVTSPLATDWAVGNVTRAPMTPAIKATTSVSTPN